MLHSFAGWLVKERSCVCFPPWSATANPLSCAGTHTHKNTCSGDLLSFSTRQDSRALPAAGRHSDCSSFCNTFYWKTQKILSLCWQYTHLTEHHQGARTLYHPQERLAKNVWTEKNTTNSHIHRGINTNVRNFIVTNSYSPWSKRCQHRPQ